MSKTLIANGVKISFDQKNEQSVPTIVFIHGNSLSRHSFAYQMQDSSLNQYRLLAFDLPGHGDSEFLSEYSIPILVEHLGALIQTLKLKNYILVGHSLGGHIAVEALKALSPAGIVITGASPVTKPMKAHAFLANPVMGHLYQDVLTDDQVLSLLQAFHETSSPGQRDIELFRKTHSHFRASLGQSLGQDAYEDEVLLWNNFRGKKAIIQGSSDRFVNVDYLTSELEVKNLWQAEVKVITGGHSLHTDNPREYNELLLQFAHDCFGSLR